MTHSPADHVAQWKRETAILGTPTASQIAFAQRSVARLLSDAQGMEQHAETLDHARKADMLRIAKEHREHAAFLSEAIAIAEGN